MEQQKTDYFDIYDYLERELELRDRKFRKQRKGRSRSKRDTSEIRAELTDFSDNITDFVPSYAASLDPNHHERAWITESVGTFYRDNLITDVTRLVKGGKEANVYCCQANPTTGMELMAAKLYRPRLLRNLKNDAVYKAGRQLRDVEGKQIKGRRYRLALRKKTNFGKQLDIEWWIGNEFRTQSRLFEAGGDVPKPVAHRSNTVLMAFIGNSQVTAPTLSEVTISSQEAKPLFERVMKNVRLMLDNHLIHGDLSAYNILYWQGEITIIDFPQMVDARTNPYGFELLSRDILRVCDYFNQYGLGADAKELTLDLWQPYMGPNFRSEFGE